MPLSRKKLILGILLVLVTAALAAPPLWWAVGNPPVINANPANNKGPANIGQAKHMAKSALNALYPVLPATAAAIEADLVGAGKPIPSWAAPANQTEKDKNHAPLLIGQLKAIAAPFYTRLHAAAPTWLEAERTANGTNHPNSIFPWTSAVSDDNNKGVANIGQLKAAFSLRFESLADLDSDGDGMPDGWEIENGFDPNDPADTNADPDGDGLTNQQELALGSDPNSFDQIGPANLGFDKQIEDFPTFTFRPTHPSDLYEAGEQSSSSVFGWKAAIGQHIEVWDEGDGNPYIELQAHLSAHGITQEFWMLPGSSVTFILRYKGRYDGWEVTDNAFSLQVEGAEAFEVRVNDAVIPGEGSLRSHSFMETDTGNQWESWQFATVTITELGNGNSLAPIAFSLAPITTTSGSEEITHGGFVDLIPVDIVAHKRGTVDAPGAEQPKGNGEYGYETVMMENADSEDNATGERDCDTAAVNKAKDNDFVKIVLHYPGLKIEGASLELKHEGIAVDATVKGSEMDNPEDAIEVLDTGSRLKFYREDGTLIEDSATELKIADLKNPGSGYLAQILDPAKNGKLTLYIEGADDFGSVGPSLGPVEWNHNNSTITDAQTAAKKLGGSRLKFAFEMGDQKTEIPLLVYRGGFLVFKQPSGMPGTDGNLEFWDGKG